MQKIMKLKKLLLKTLLIKVVNFNDNFGQYTNGQLNTCRTMEYPPMQDK